MKFRYGFKTEANDIANEVRAELGLGPLEALDPHRLASFLAIPVLALSELVQDDAGIRHLIGVEPDAFSAVTVFDGTRRLIVHNDGHAPTRQASNLSHELSHGLLGHPPTPALDDTGCRIWSDAIEGEATWLAGILLVTEAATIEIAGGRWSPAEAARYFGVSEQMIQFRVNATGARKRVERARARCVS